MKYLISVCLFLFVITIEGRRYGEKRPPFHSLKGFSGGPRKTFGGKGIIGNKKRTGFFDGFRRKGFLGGPRKGFKESIITDKGLIPPISDIIPLKPDIMPVKPGFIPGKSDIIPGFIPGNPDFIPGKSDIIPGFIPGKSDINPVKPGFIPEKSDIIPGFIPGNPGFIPGKSDIIPGKPGIIPGKSGIIPGKSDIIPGKTGIIPDKTGVIDACPPRPCLQTQEFIPQECRRPQFFLHNGRECPDCDIDICIGGSVLPDIRGGWGSGLGPRGTLSPGGPIGPRGNLPGDLDWQSDFGPGFPDASPGINTQIGGGLFPDLPFAGRFGPDRFNRGLGGVDQFGVQNRGQFGQIPSITRFRGFDQSGIQNRGQFGPIPGIARTGLVNRLNAGFDFDPSWNTGNVGDFGASWRDNTLPINSRSI